MVGGPASQWMRKRMEDRNGLQIWFLDTCKPNSFSTFTLLFVAFVMVFWERYLFDTKR